MAQLRQHFIEQLVRRDVCMIRHLHISNYWKKNCLYSTYLLQTEDECLGTLNLINLPSLTHSLLDNVTIIIVILEMKKKTVKDEKLVAWIILRAQYQKKLCSIPSVKNVQLTLMYCLKISAPVFISTTQ